MSVYYTLIRKELQEHFYNNFIKKRSIYRGSKHRMIFINAYERINVKKLGEIIYMENRLRVTNRTMGDVYELLIEKSSLFLRNRRFLAMPK